MWNLKYDTNEFIYKTEIDSQTQNKLMVTKGGKEGKEMDCESGVGRLHLGCINDTILMYSRGNYIRYLVINHDRKENKKQ